MADRKEELTQIAKPRNAAVLGTLQGPCADIINPTRNGRVYDEALWDKSFGSDIAKELFEAGGIIGELGHPADRTETDPTKAAICMRKPPEKGKDGLLIGTWDILDTPNGRILKTLVDYGYKIGISSRGTGDVYEGDDGAEHVDEDSYDFQAFDAVIVPAVKAARLTPLGESLKGKTLRAALNEALARSSEEDRKVMAETLGSLDIGYKADEASNIDDKKNDEGAPKGASPKAIVEGAAADGGADEITKSLQEAVKAKAELEAKVLDLQSKAAVGDAKAAKLEEDLRRANNGLMLLSAAARESKDAKARVSSLEEELKVKARVIEALKRRADGLRESKKAESESAAALTESISGKDAEIAGLKAKVNSLTEEISAGETKRSEASKEAESKAAAKDAEFGRRLSESKAKVEGYRKFADGVMGRYIKCQAKMAGVKVEDVVRRLGESYTADDVDTVCEDLQSYQLSVSKLPFGVDSGRKVKVRVTESKNESILGGQQPDDSVDESLMKLASL